MKGQLSAEMLILIAVVLAVVAIAAIQLMGSARETSENIQGQTEKLGEITGEAIKSPEGGYCFSTDDCQDGLRCDDGTHKCE